ncbi:PKD domain-containing protein [Sediminicola sp. 1XM1-17]|uniref:PKD domain-containing protein n=1 Tax=Sediminicola sp. 1XM1-17 TaxID=3127702 RepID=UPI00307746E1
MKKKYFSHSWSLIIMAMLSLNAVLYGQINFNVTGLNGENLNNPTSLAFGPDGKLYVSQQDGKILQYTVSRDNASPGNGSYTVTSTSTINSIKNNVPNHNDDGSNNTIQQRQVTGIYVAGTATNPILYVSSSDWRISVGVDSGLDTNSGVLSKLTWNGSSWIKVDLVRGLPRCEENHSTNGMDIFTKNGNTYLLLQQGGNTNKGAPSNNFSGTSETFLSSSILIINLTQLEGMPEYTDPRSGTKYVYDLPTLDDPSRTNITNTNSNFPYQLGHPMYNATIDSGDPFGGNNSLNQAFTEEGGPVQIFSPGYRNAYDVVVTQNNKIYTSDNGPNTNWGGVPVIFNSNGTVKTTNGILNPSSTDYITNDFNENGSGVIGDALHLVGTINDANNNYYGGHPVPIRAFPSRAKVRKYEKNGSTWSSVPSAGYNLADLLTGVRGYFKQSFSINDFPDDNRQGEYLSGNENSSKVKILDVINSSTNGICEYTASNFGGAMLGNILTASFNGTINRYNLNAAGDGFTNQNTSLFSGFGSEPLDVIAQGDNDPFPGTVWAATYGANNITIFEPADFNNDCISDPNDPNFVGSADSDNDGYTNQDEVENGTNPCNGGDKPKDNDGDFISDLNDDDDDNDGIADLLDAFQWDANNGTTTNMPIGYPFWNNDPGTGYAGLGFTGWMTNGQTDYLETYDPQDLAFGGAGGAATLERVTSGDAYQGVNNQENAFQFGINVDNTSPSFTVHSKLLGPFFGNPSVNPLDFASQGIYIGTGDQDNYLKVVVSKGLASGGTISGIEVALETNGNINSTSYDFFDLTAIGSSIDLFIAVNPSLGTAQPYYSMDGGTTLNIIGGPINLPSSFLDPNDNKGMAVGIISTSTGVAPEFAATWDFINVLPDSSVSELRFNAGGPAITHSGLDFSADGNFVGGQSYSNANAQVPEMYKTERSSPTKTFQYNIPLANGNYTVILHFAEIYWGATGGGTGGIGKRVFDVNIEGNLVMDNYDIYADVGAETVVTKSFDVDLQDGSLNINFSALAGVGGIDQPKLSALEIIENNTQYPPIVVSPIGDQINEEGDISNLSVSATGGNPQANFSYSISGQPTGINIEPTNGQIYGTLATGSNGVYSVSVTVAKPGSTTVTIGFNWTIGISWANKTNNGNYTARHECSFVQAGDKFYLMGGRENPKTLDIYDYKSNSWTSLSNSAPQDFNHFQATEYQGLIWVIGAFKTNAYPNELSADHIWAFDPATQTWIQGAEIPAGRKRGSSGLVVYNDKFYVVGGNSIGHDGGFVPWFDEYDPATNTWTTLTNAPRARDHFHAVVIGDKLYAAGGRLTDYPDNVFNQTISEVDVYDFTNNSWSTLPSNQNIPTQRAGAAAVNLNNKLIVIGGENGNNTNALKTTEQFDPSTGTWSQLPDLNNQRHGTQAIVSGTGIFITAGSPTRGGGNQKNMEVLGADNPSGVASVASILSVPSNVQIEVGNISIVSLDITGGNNGVIIKSMSLSGPNAAEFNISSGKLTNSLLKPNSTHPLELEFTGSTEGQSAILTINYGANLVKQINLQSGAAPPQSGVIGFTLVNADTDLDLLNLSEGIQIDQNNTQGIGLNIRANTSPVTVGSVFLSISGPVNNTRVENVAVYALFGNIGPDYTAVPLPLGDYTISATAYSGSGQTGNNLGSLTYQFSIVNQANSCWGDLANAGESRLEAPSAKVNDKLYVFGGFIENLLVTGATEIYDSTNDTWSTGAPMPLPATHMGVVAVTNDIWVIGGFLGDHPGTATDKVQIYNTITNSWSYGPDLPALRGSGTAALNGRKIHFFGGLLPDRNTDVGEHYVLDLDNLNNGWTPAAPLPNPRNHLGSATINGIIYAIGGQFGHDNGVADQKYVHAYNPITDIWTQMADLPVARSHFEPGIATHNGNIIIVGGRQGEFIFDDVTKYDPQLNQWTELCKLPEPLLAPAAKIFDDRLVVANGGVNGICCPSNTTRWLQLEPATNQPPLAVIGASTISGDAPLTVNFTGSNSTDDNFDGTGTLNYSWTFGDGNTSTESNPTHTFNGIGIFNVDLVVTDGGGLTNLSSLSITVNDPLVNQSPTAVATGTPNGTTPFQIDFSSTGSDDPDGNVVGYAWDFGDGVGTSSEENPTYTYAAAGFFTVTLVVTDNDGDTGSTSIQVEASDPNQNGVVSMTLVNADADTDLFGLTPNMQINQATVQGLGLNIRANTNPAVVGSVFLSITGPVTNTRVENVAVYALFGNNGSNYFAVPFPLGNYTVSATAYSGSNQSGTNLGTLTRSFSVVSQGGGNLPPVAVANGIPNNTTPLQIDFSSAGSGDSDGNIVSYAWDFGDGIGTSTEENPSYTYASSGTYNVTLTVTDDDLETGTTSIQINFGNPPNITNPLTQNNIEGDVIALQIEATDESTNLTYSATGLPPTLSIDQNTGLISGTISSGSGGGGFLESNGLVVIESESATLVPTWSLTAQSGATGIIAGSNHFNSQNGGTLSYVVNISTPGVYRFNWRSFFSGSISSDENDNWLRFPNNNDVWFFGFKGAPSSEASLISNLQGSQTNIVFPVGSSRVSATTTPEGSSSNGYFKIWRSSGSSGVYDWQARTSDNDAHNIYVWFVNPGTYTMEISERSAGHAIDKIALYKVDGPSYTNAQLTAFAESPNGTVGASENSPYNVEITVMDDDITSNSSSVQFDWIVWANINQPPNAIATANPMNGVAPLTVNFTGSNSTDNSGIVGYQWNFGDGTPTSSQRNPSHVYVNSGTYNAVLTVTDDDGFQDTATITINVNSTTQNGVISFSLVDADQDVDLLNLVNNQQINESITSGKTINIRANTNPAAVGSVRLTLTGPVSNARTENVAPYALFGDSSGNYSGVLFPLGNYTITATAYSGSNLGGNNLGTLSQSFSIVSSAKGNTKDGITGLGDESQGRENHTLRHYPNPSSVNTEIAISDPQIIVKDIYIRDISGRLIARYDAAKIKKGEGIYEFNVSGLENGIYLVSLVNGSATVMSYKLVVRK